MLIGELATISGLSKDGIRHYEELGLITSTGRRAGSRQYRDYDAKALTTIENVRQGQRLGLSLKEIGPLLAAYYASDGSEEQTIPFMRQRLETVRAKIVELKVIEDFIAKKLDRLQAGKCE